MLFQCKLFCPVNCLQSPFCGYRSHLSVKVTLKQHTHTLHKNVVSNGGKTKAVIDYEGT